ncbi:hypothetical protein BX600DRAFT_198944 [Xylariales sp. PMI_506]|nr:hypothetical protein BX600DRAFT_198944 [Xylariales sp. PMI_506]
MGLFSSLQDERLIFAGLGLATVGFIGMMQLILTFYRDEVEIKPKSPKTQYITQETEDALGLDTLDNLFDHYNYSIRETAVKIVVGRAVNDLPTVHYLLVGITRPEYDEREKNLRTLAFAVEDRDTSQDALKVLHNRKGYSALVRSLELSLGDRGRERLDDPLWDEYYLRDVNERRCITLISQLVHRYGADMLVAAQFVEKWLAKQDWGDNEQQRQTNFTRYWQHRKNRISSICSHLVSSKSGRKALRHVHLMGKGRSGLRERSGNGIKVILEISMSNEEGDNEEIQQENFQTELIPRIVDQSAEEQRRRRRHREAIVLNDGTHSLGRGDIIEREHDSTT